MLPRQPQEWMPDAVHGAGRTDCTSSDLPTGMHELLKVFSCRDALFLCEINCTNWKLISRYAGYGQRGNRICRITPWLGKHLEMQSVYRIVDDAQSITAAVIAGTCAWITQRAEHEIGIGEVVHLYLPHIFLLPVGLALHRAVCIEQHLIGIRLMDGRE